MLFVKIEIDCEYYILVRNCSVVNKKDTISNDFLAETNSYAC